MKIIKSLILVSFLLLIVTGCAQKTTIKAIKAAKVTDQAIKNIGVLPFDSDNIAQSSQIDSEISNIKINDKPYFNLVDRNNLKKVMAEKTLNDSGLVNLIKKSRDKGLSQIETLVTGKVNVSDVSSSNYYESRTDYSRCARYGYYKSGKRYCAAYRKYNVSCQAKTYHVNTKVKLIKISNADTLFTNNYSASSKLTKCTDQNRVLPTKQAQNTKLAANIAEQLIKDIAPSYIYFKVVLFDDPDIDYTAKDKLLLKSALALIKAKRIKKANELLKKVVKHTKNQSYVSLYDLAVTEEALGNVKGALDLYKQAEDISLLTKPQDEISQAINRAEKNLAELNKANNQL